MDSYGIKNVGGHFRFQELVMTKGIHIVNAMMIQLFFMVQFSSSKSYIHTCGLRLNYGRVITIIFFQGIKILFLIRHNAHLNGYRLEQNLLSSKIAIMCSK